MTFLTLVLSFPCGAGLAKRKRAGAIITIEGKAAAVVVVVGHETDSRGERNAPKRSKALQWTSSTKKPNSPFRTVSCRRGRRSRSRGTRKIRRRRRQRLTVL